MWINKNGLGLRGRPWRPTRRQTPLGLTHLGKAFFFEKKRQKAFIGAVAGSSGKLRAAPIAVRLNALMRLYKRR
jgi:hypothetical protein